MKKLLIVFLIFFSFAVNAQELKAVFAGKTGGKISRKEFLAEEKLKIISSDKDTSWKVESYRIAFAGKGISYREIQINDERISAQVDSIVRTAPPDIKIFIEYINAKQDDNNSVKKISPLSFILTD